MGSVKRLRGWGQIENYLGLSRNTILAHGYPIHKQGVGGSVFAYSCELDKHECGVSVPHKRCTDRDSQKLTEIHIG